jgi:uncharacterized protein (TIGR00251 family)
VEPELTRIEVRVQPNARRSELVGFEDGVWRVRIAAPPVKGKANKELLEFLSDILGLSKSQLAIEKGLLSRRKVVSISGLTPDQVMEQIAKPGQGEKTSRRRLKGQNAK